MHHIYHTTGFIVGQKNIGEANRLYHIFTRELGMVTATAQGARRIDSKTRFAIQEYGYAHIDLVRGKEMWRITSVTPILHPVFFLNKNSRLLYVQILHTIRRLSGGEELNEEVFDILSNFLNILSDIEEEFLSVLEIVVMVQILFHLGYWQKEESDSEDLYGIINKELLLNLNLNKISIVTRINNALLQTQL